MEKYNVLFTACCGWPTCGTIDALKKSKDYDFHVIGVDCNPYTAALNYVDELYKVPRYDDEDYISKLIQICVEKHVDVVVPLISDEINVLCEHEKMFSDVGVKLALTHNHEKLKIANNKIRLQKYLEKNKIHVMPKTIVVDRENIESALNELGYPEKSVCLKRTDGCGASGFRIIDDEMARKAVFAKSRNLRANKYVSKAQMMDAIDILDHDFMLQEFLPGQEFSVICLADKGRTLYSITHRNLRMDFATTTYCELTDFPEANEIVRKINALLELDGNIGFDFIHDEKGGIKLLEINPRISATVSLAAKAGVNLVELGVLHALGKEIPTDLKPEYGMRLFRNYGTLYEKEGIPCGR